MEPCLAAAVIATAARVAVVTVAANKDNYEDDYPRAAVSTKETVITVTHITDLLSVFNIILCKYAIFVTIVGTYKGWKKFKNNV